MKQSKILLIAVATLLLTGCARNNDSQSLLSSNLSSSIESSVEQVSSSEDKNSTSEVSSSAESSEEPSKDITLDTEVEVSSSISSSSLVSSIYSQESSSSKQSSISSSEEVSSISSKDSSINSQSSSSIESSSSSGAINYEGYYKTIDANMSKEKLFDQLHTIISANYKALGYGGLWDAYGTTDVYPGTRYIWDIYSNCKYDYAKGHSGSYSKEGDMYNREHTTPQSWWGGGTGPNQGNDLFNVYPTDGKVNGMRSNYPYGEVSSPTYTSGNGSKLGPNTYGSYKGTVFEPIDEYKGDLARTYFYMCTRYDQESNTFNQGNGNVVYTKSFPYLTSYATSLFVKWSQQDPVSQKEIDRNNAVYKLQKNRNPYIDHPEFIDKIFGGHNTSDQPISDDNTKSDQEYANKVINLIKAIGTVGEWSGDAITQARSEYNKLTSSQKELVTNYYVLTQAENEYAALQSGEDPVDPTPSNSVTTTFSGSLSNANGYSDENLDWTFSTGAQSIEANRGLQFTNSAYSKLEISTESYTNTISKIALNMATNYDTPASFNIEVSVGGTILTGPSALSNKDLTDYTYTLATPAKGKVIIKITTEVSKKSIYFKSITIN